MAANAYSVGEGFPRIEAAQLPHGLSSVTYWLRLDHCAPFEHPYEDLFSEELSQ